MCHSCKRNTDRMRRGGAVKTVTLPLFNEVAWNKEKESLGGGKRRQRSFFFFWPQSGDEVCVQVCADGSLGTAKDGSQLLLY